MRKILIFRMRLGNLLTKKSTIRGFLFILIFQALSLLKIVLFFLVTQPPLGTKQAGCCLTG